MLQANFFRFILVILFLFKNFLAQDLAFEIKSEDNETPAVEYVIEEPMSIQDGPVKFEIVGDTAHLFEAEDFEKKEVLLLREKDDTNNDTLSLNSNFNSTSNQTDGKNENNQTITTKFFNKFTHPECNGYNKTPHRDLNLVFRINGSSLTHLLAGSDPNDCFTVLFYVPWCPYSAKLAPIYNALPRAFLNLDFYAIDISKSIGYNTKFGTSAVPIIIIFKQRNVLGKFNYTDKTLNDYIEFVANKTGYKENKTINIEYYDYEGPVPTVPEKYFDYFLLISWLFLIFVSTDFLFRKTNFICFCIEFLKKVMHLNRNGLLELPQPPHRPMIQHNNNYENQNRANLNHPHAD